jgi:GMP synthase (glutamine-hydrolysing)
MRKEWGPHRVDVVAPDPLFDGLADAAVVEQRHFWELKAVPQGFERLAGSPACPIQAIRHRVLPLYGVQFHPERFSERHPDGRVILTNFFRLAGQAAAPRAAGALARA